MELSFDQYPVFQPNQVLTSRSLNDAFNYLDEQSRVTRVNLIGIGIVCGLEIKLDTSAGTAIKLSRGCGVTSQGYLIVEPEDVSLVAWRDYVLPDDVDYPPFKNGDTAYPMQELFPDGIENTTRLDDPGNPAGFLDSKSVVLFLELKKEGLRNCSPNNCDDKGAEITATVRRVLINTSDLDKIIAATNVLGTGLTASDLSNALSARLQLPDLAVLRFDVLNSDPVTSNDVYAGFLNVFKTAGLAGSMGTALSAAYKAFQPLLQAAYPSDPFTGFTDDFGFLDSAPASTDQVRFLQYYADVFDDLVAAYDEFRWKGIDLICACCPPDGLFPRHLMLGILHPEKSDHPGQYRETFRPSPAVGDCAADTKIVLQLFSRLVEMAARFTNTPPLPAANNQASTDPQIRVTPSIMGDAALGKKAIPYYYLQDGTPPLYQLWNVDKSRRNRANQNLGYRSDEFEPAAPAFVTDALRYDLERYGFLRIEGHLGKNYQAVLSSLLLLKSQYRLPIDVIALRTGVYDDTVAVDLAQQSARFQDLEALYDALREQILATLTQGAMDIYDVPIAGNQLPAGTPKLSLLQTYAPNYKYPAGSVGAVYEEHLDRFRVTPYIDIDQTLLSDPSFALQVLRVYCGLFLGISDVPNDKFAHVVSLFYFSKLADDMPATLNTLAFADFQNRYQDLLALVHFFRNDIAANVGADLKSFVPQAELIDQFDEVLYSCKLDAVKAVYDEFVRRVGLLKKMQFLSTFVQEHPGIQHKAGVPLGGTFLLVYHGQPAPLLNLSDTILGRAATLSTAVQATLAVDKPLIMEAAAPSRAAAVPQESAATVRTAETAKAIDVKKLALTGAINRLSSNRVLIQNPDISLIIGSLTGRIPIDPVGPIHGLEDPASQMIAQTVNQLDDGTVIADFFLPYKISSDCPGIEFVLPKPAPIVSATVGCTNADSNASVDLLVKGGAGPYDVSVDVGSYAALESPLQLAAGTHTVKVRDNEGVESAPLTIKIPIQMNLGTVQYTCAADGTFTATFPIAGGTPPYTVNGKPAPGNTFTTDAAASGTAVAIEVLDSLQCSLKTSLTHDCPPPCNLPCKGIAIRHAYRFWLLSPDRLHQYTELAAPSLNFTVETTQGKSVDLTKKVLPILKAQPQELNVSFDKVVTSWLDQINKIIAGTASLNGGGKANWLTLSYETLGPGRLGTLWIEHFECLNFSIKISTRFAISGLEGAQQLVATYDPSGTSLKANKDAAVTAPPSNPQRSDKCNPASPVENICAKVKLPKVAISVTSQKGLSASLSVTAAPDSSDLRFLWEAQDGTPAMGNGRTFNTQFTSGGTHGILVTAYTKDGCSVSNAISVNIG